MPDLLHSLYNIRQLDDFARKESAIHRLHPLTKLITTVIYLAVVVSFGKYDVTGLLPFVFFPVIIFSFSEIPTVPMLKRILWVEPFIIAIALFNPLFDRHTVMLGGLAVSKGWLTFISIFIKSSLTVTVSLLLIATTGMDKLAGALRMLRIPKLFVLQLLLTYRYLSVLFEEVSRMIRAYALRAPGQKGIHRNAWGSFAGQLLLRTYDRAQRIYESMSLRGFTGDYHTGETTGFQSGDLIYLAGWGLFFILARIFNLPQLMGLLFTGVNG